jgi:hypothetical protein
LRIAEEASSDTTKRHLHILAFVYKNFDKIDLVASTLEKGKFEIGHNCAAQRCFNPDHVELKSHTENEDDKGYRYANILRCC